MKLKLIDLEFVSEKFQWYRFIFNNDYRASYSVKGWHPNGERKDINVPVFSCWLQDKEFKEISDTSPIPAATIKDFLLRLLDGASSCNFEDELTLHLGYMLADNTKPDKEKNGD